MASNQRTRGLAALLAPLIVLTGCSRGPKDLVYIENGKKLLAKKDYARAALEFGNAIQANPKSFTAYYEMALAEIGLGEKVTAYRALTKALDLNPKDAGAQLQMAELLLKSNSPEEVKQAQDHAKAVLESSPNDPDALDAIAVAELKLGNPDEGLELLEQACSRAPDHLKSAVELSLVKLARKDTAGAQKVLEQIVERTPNSLEARTILAAFYLATGKLPASEQQFRVVLQKDPNNSLALFDLAGILRSSGRTGEAEEIYRRLSNVPGSPYRSVYGTYLLRNGKQKEAVAEFERQAKLDPKDINARTRLIAVYIATERVADARQLLEATLRKNRRDTAALLQRSELSILAGAYKEARQDLDRVLHLAPDSAKAHFLLASVERAQGNALKYRQQLSETLQLDPRFFAARIALAQSYIAAGDGPNALDLMNRTPVDQRSLGYVEYRNWALLAAGDLQELQKGIAEGLAKARTRDLLLQDALLRLRQGNEPAGRSRLLEILKNNPEDLAAVDILIRSYAAHQQLAGALEQVRLLISERPKSAPLQYRLGLILKANRKPDEARAAYAAALTIDPRFPQARLALAALDQSEGKPDAARQELDPLLTSKDGEFLARTELGYVEAKAGNFSKAIEHLQKVVEAEPANVIALNNLAYLLADNTNEIDDALKYAQKAKELAPNNVSVAGTLGWVYFRKGMYAIALKELKSAVDREGKDVIDGTAIRRYHLAMAYAKTGDGGEARKALSAAMQLAPNLPEMRVAVQMMAESR